MKKKKKDLDFYKKGYLRLQIELGLLFLLLLIIVIGNFNYIVFKYLIGTKYIYTDTLKDIYNEEISLNTENYFKYFDEVSIQLFIDKIQEKNNDEFTQLYSIGEYNNIKEDMKNEALKSGFELLNDNIGCMTITNFSSTSKNIVYKSKEDMNNCSTLIIDLRNNTGGVVSDAKNIAQLFLNKNDIIYKAKTKKGEKLYTSLTDKEVSNEKIIILQNNLTASAAEIFINALKENLDNVEIVGTRSYGKGIGQDEHFMLKKYGVKATTTEFYTPNNNFINIKGITPDTYCETDAKKYVLEKLNIT